MKLGTVEGPLTVRLVTSRPEDQKSVGLATVRATEKGFKASDPAELLIPKDGLFRSARPLAHVACVTVSLGQTRAVQFPVPVLGPDPVSLPFEINPRLEEEAALTRLVLAAAARVTDARNAQTICFDATAKLIEKQKNADALARARGGFQAADAADKSITDDLARIKESSATTAEAQRLIASIENQLISLRAFNAKLDSTIKTLDAVVKRENDPTIAAKEVQAEALNARLAVLLGQGELDQAIATYNQLLALYPDNADLKARRDQLLAEKQPKSDAHGKARKYLLETWAALAAIPDFKDSLPQLTSAIDECVKVGDKFTLRKLLTVFTATGAKLNELTSSLDPNTEADRKLAADSRAVVEKLAEQEGKITRFVEGK
jgi:tetratricopeptide (TPR) repeat protein